MPTTRRTIAALLGLVVTGFGAWLRLAARELAWPASFSYGGPREDTIWAIRERAYEDLSLVILGVGAIILLMVLGQWLWSGSARLHRPG